MITKHVGFTIDIDEEAIAPASPNVFIFQFLNRLSYEHGIKSITIDDVTKEITDPTQIKNLPLKQDEDLKEETELKTDTQVEMEKELINEKQ